MQWEGRGGRLWAAVSYKADGQKTTSDPSVGYMQGNGPSGYRSHCPQSVVCVLWSRRLRSTGLYCKQNSGPAEMTTLLLVLWFQYGVSPKAHVLKTWFYNGAAVLGGSGNFRRRGYL